jgi:short-subunit dehydrogenase
MPVPAPSPDSRAVVTGASQGIGEALATELAARGHSLIITARRGEVLAELAARLTERYGVTVEVRAVDLADPAARTALADELAGRNISILCANAGTATFGPVARLDPAGEKDQVQLNVLGVHDLVLAVLPGMLARGKGSIVNMASAASSVKGVPNRFAYGTTKAAVIGLTKAIAADYVARGVRCNAICPGTVKSPSLEQRVAALGGDSDAAWKSFIDRQPMGRLGTPEEIAALAVYLASEEASFTTGAIHVIDGGWTD